MKIYVVTINDGVDSVWDDRERAEKRSAELHDPYAKKFQVSFFSSVDTYELNCYNEKEYDSHKRWDVESKDE